MGPASVNAGFEHDTSDCSVTGASMGPASVNAGFELTIATPDFFAGSRGRQFQILQRRQKIIECDFSLFQNMTQRAALDRPMGGNCDVDGRVAQLPLHTNMAASLSNNGKSEVFERGHNAFVAFRRNLAHRQLPYFSDTVLVSNDIIQQRRLRKAANVRKPEDSHFKVPGIQWVRSRTTAVMSAWASLTQPIQKLQWVRALNR